MDDKPNQKSKISALLKLRAQEASIPITQFSKSNQESSPPQGFKKNTSFSSSDSSSSSSQSSPSNSPKNTLPDTLQLPKKTSATNSQVLSDDGSIASNHFPHPNPSPSNKDKPKIPHIPSKELPTNPRNVLNTPNFLKEYHYRRTSNQNGSSLLKEGPNNEVKEIHQMTQFAGIASSTFRSVKSSARSSSSQDTAMNKTGNELKAEKMESQVNI